jgi:hypothetical protein
MIALVDFPALANSPGHRNEGNTLSTLCNNFASERIRYYPPLPAIRIHSTEERWTPTGSNLQAIGTTQ